MHSSHRPFLPAAGHDLALPLYDPLTSWLGAPARRRILLERAGLRAGQRVLDIGCGTGSLAIALKTAHPGIEVSALDPDLRALARAKKKAARARVQLHWDHGYGDAVTYADASFARVLSSFMLHHLHRPAQQRLLAEALRVLEPGGSIHIVDFASSTRRRVTGVTSRAEQIDQDMRAAGFDAVSVQPQPRWLVFPVVYACGTRAG